MFKVGNLEDLLAEKEEQLTQVKTQSTNSIESSDSAISAMEESLSDKDKQIERLEISVSIMKWFWMVVLGVNL